MAGISEDEQIDLLFKKFTNTVNANPVLPFSNTQNRRFPFQNFEFSKNLFIDDIPENLDNITYNELLGSAALDASFGVATDISYEIPNYPLLYYHRIELTNALDGLNNTSWYYPDPNNNKLSLLRGSIPFNYDPINFTYKQLLYSNSNQEEALNSDPLYWLFDYKSGFIQFYGDPAAVTNWINTNGPPRLSVIVYNGDKGLENFSGGGGGGSIIGGNVYNNLDVSGNISANNLFMNLRQNIINGTSLIKSFSSITSDKYGYAVSLSGNGNILIVSAPERSSYGFNYNGEIIVYENLNSTWQQRDTINGSDNNLIGKKTAINYDGTVIAFSNPEENSDTGFVRIYKYINLSWIQIGSTLFGSQTSQQFGNSLALNNDGTVLAIGSPYYYSDGNYKGKVEIYQITDTTVSKLSEIVGHPAIYGLGFGEALALSLDGNILAIGCPDGDNNGTYKGEVYIYNISSEPYINIGSLIGESSYDRFGASISLNFDGYKILIGAPKSDSQGSNTGSAYLYEYNSDSNIWLQKGNTLYGESAENYFGISSCINSDGSIIVVGSTNDVNSTDGYVYVKLYKVNNIIELQYRLTHSYLYFIQLGSRQNISLSNNGKTLAIGAYPIQTTYIYNIYDYVVYNEGEINFVANNENISKIISTYDGNESTINFSVLNNNLLDNRVIINKDGIDISGNINANNLSTYIQQNDNISLLNNDSGYIKNSDNISLLNNDSGYIKNGDTIHAEHANSLYYYKDGYSYLLNLTYEHSSHPNLYTRLLATNSASGGNSVHVRYADSAGNISFGHDNRYYELYVTYESGVYSNIYTRLYVTSTAEGGNSVHVRYADSAGSASLATVANRVSTPINQGYYWTITQIGFDLHFYSGTTLKAVIRHNGWNDTWLNFTGQHRCFLNNNITNNYSGLIVSVKENYINIDNNIKPTINDSLPYCEITKKYKDTRVFGVLSYLEDKERTFGAGNFVSLYIKTNANEHRFFVNSIGEGSIWVCNYNGVINNGDYIVSSSIDGYGCKQDDDILHNYTVAKITCQCNFNLNLVSKKRVKTEKIITYIEEDAYENISENTEKKRIIFNEELQRYIEESYIETTSKREKVYDEFDLYNENGNIIGKHRVTRKEIIEKEEQNIVYDEKGDVVFEDDLDENGNIQYEYEYDTRFLDENANILSGKEEYLSRLNNGENVYIACFVGCTYHCG